MNYKANTYSRQKARKEGCKIEKGLHHFDSKLDMKQHVAMVCRSPLFQLRKMGTIRKYLSNDSCATLVHSFVTSRIDYCNSLLANLPNCVLSKIQKVQNVAARILTRHRDFHDISPVLSTSTGFLFCYEFVTKSIFWLSNVSMSSDLLSWKIFSLPISLNETSDQLLKDFLKKIWL